MSTDERRSSPPAPRSTSGQKKPSRTDVLAAVSLLLASHGYQGCWHIEVIHATRRRRSGCRKARGCQWKSAAAQRRRIVDPPGARAGGHALWMNSKVCRLSLAIGGLTLQHLPCAGLTRRAGRLEYEQRRGGAQQARKLRQGLQPELGDVLRASLVDLKEARGWRSHSEARSRKPLAAHLPGSTSSGPNPAKGTAPAASVLSTQFLCGDRPGGSRRGGESPT